jgi:hypothetical protein
MEQKQNSHKSRAICNETDLLPLTQYCCICRTLETLSLLQFQRLDTIVRSWFENKAFYQTHFVSFYFVAVNEYNQIAINESRTLIKDIQEATHVREATAYVLLYTKQHGGGISDWCVSWIHHVVVAVIDVANGNEESLDMDLDMAAITGVDLAVVSRFGYYRFSSSIYSLG